MTDRTEWIPGSIESTSFAPPLSASEQEARLQRFEENRAAITAFGDAASPHSESDSGEEKPASGLATLLGRQSAAIDKKGTGQAAAR